MKINAMYFSPTKTTRHTVEAICKGLGSSEKTYDFTLAKGRKNIPTFTKEDLLVLGVPVYAGRIPEFTESYLKEIKGDGTPIVLVAVYGNRHYDDALLEMKDMFSKQGFKPVAAGGFIGVHSYTQKVAAGRPDSTDLAFAEDFGKQVKTLLEKENGADLSLEIPGNHPYRERKTSEVYGPKVDNTCIKCGMCVINCPTGALILDGPVKVKPELCIKCHACIRSCPIEAIAFDGGAVKRVATYLEENFMERREPEIFIMK